MNSVKSLRSFNPNLVEYFANTSIPKVQNGFRQLIRPSTCQEILDKLNLTDKYPNSKSSLDIIDIYPGFGLFSTMLNYELKPRNHILLDSNASVGKLWDDRINYLKALDDKGVDFSVDGNFKIYKQAGYTWETFDNLLKVDKIIDPVTKPRSNIHDELLISANLTNTTFGEMLFAQWIMCCGYGNWIQKYGRVRMLCFLEESTAQKFMLQSSFIKRNKMSIKTATFTEAKIIGITESQDLSEPSGIGYDPNSIIQHQPIVFPKKSIIPPAKSIALLEIEPKDIDNEIDIDVDMFEYFIKLFVFRKTSTVIDALKHVAPGADLDIGPNLPSEMKLTQVKDLSIDQILHIYNEFDKWPFKPSYLDTIEVSDFEDRRF